MGSGGAGSGRRGVTGTPWQAGGGGSLTRAGAGLQAYRAAGLSGGAHHHSGPASAMSRTDVREGARLADTAAMQPACKRQIWLRSAHAAPALIGIHLEGRAAGADQGGGGSARWGQRAGGRRARHTDCWPALTRGSAASGGAPARHKENIFESVIEPVRGMVLHTSGARQTDLTDFCAMVCIVAGAGCLQQ